MKSILACFSLLLIMSGCVTSQPKSSQTPLPLEEAARQLAVRLFQQIHEKKFVLNNLSQSHIVVDPFINADTAEATETSKHIEAIVVDEAHKQFEKLDFRAMTPENMDAAKYLLTGIMKLDKHSQVSGGRYYKVSASLVDLKSGMVVAHSENWIAEQKLNATPISIYAGSPMYLKDKRTDGLIQTAQSPAGDEAEKIYFDSLSTAALLNEGDKAYEQKQYERAMTLYKETALRPDGQVMKTYAGLYQTYRKLGRADDSEIAFGRLVVIGFSNKNLSAKLMFSVNSTDFISDPDLRSQYAIWLRQIARQFSKTPDCLEIAGHSSRTGGETYNESLSLQRALQVQKTMLKDYPQLLPRSKTYGRGWRENIIGTGSDDTQDAIDRRVEFKIVSCGR
ncbi:MAG: OmpA family protein [Sulfuricellaceae bacterium]|nr:OmpA family protein [Sulfuricellaceae bacterium]